MIVVAPWLLDVDVGVWLVACPLTLALAVLLPLARRQARHQSAEDAAVDRWRSGGSGE